MSDKTAGKIITGLREALSYAQMQQELDASRAREARLVEALFPPAKDLGGGCWLDAAADYNLMGALYDLKRQGADDICVKTIQRVLEQIQAARAALYDTPAEMPSDVHPQGE